MPIEIDVDEANRLVSMFASGTVDDVEALAAMARLHELGALCRGYDFLADASGVEKLSLTTQAIRGIAVGGPPFGAASRRALVVPSLLAYGLGRMYSAFAGDGSGALRLFRSREEALEWLGCEPMSETDEASPEPPERR